MDGNDISYFHMGTFNCLCYTLVLSSSVIEIMEQASLCSFMKPRFLSEEDRCLESYVDLQHTWYD